VPYEVRLKPAARRDLKGLERQDARRIGAAIDALQQDARPPGCKKLAGGSELYRIVVGQFRILYEVHDGEVLLVVRVGNRRDVYRGL
jgi:mRNA interferase RelE/StbE